MAWEHINLVRPTALQYIAKLILFALASRVDDEGKCWPSIDTICHDTGLKRRTTQLHLKGLVETGYVIRHERLGRTALLRLNLRMLATSVPETVAHALHPGVHATPNSGAGHAPEVEIEQPINRQGRKLFATANPPPSSTATTRRGGQPLPGSTRRAENSKYLLARAKATQRTRTASSLPKNSDESRLESSLLHGGCSMWTAPPCIIADPQCDYGKAPFCAAHIWRAEQPAVILSSSELVALTRRDRPSAQARVLRLLRHTIQPAPDRWHAACLARRGRTCTRWADRSGRRHRTVRHQRSGDPW